VAEGQQPVSGMRADEPGATSNEDLHFVGAPSEHSH
jgi:hypothetical protein